MSWRPSRKADYTDREWFADHPYALALTRALADDEDTPTFIRDATHFLVLVKRTIVPMWGIPTVEEIITHTVHGTTVEDIHEAYPQDDEANLLVTLLEERRGTRLAWCTNYGRWRKLWGSGRGRREVAS
jgi:hypothetical protein